MWFWVFFFFVEQIDEERKWQRKEGSVKFRFSDIPKLYQLLGQP
jgi:hypothetical protein